MPGRGDGHDVERRPSPGPSASGVAWPVTASPLGDLLVEAGRSPASTRCGRPSSLPLAPRGQAPDQDRERQQGERHPGPGDPAGGQGVPARPPSSALGVRVGVVLEPPLAPSASRAGARPRRPAGWRPPNEVDQLEADEVRPGELDRRRTSRRSTSKAGQTASVSPPADHRPDQPERDDQRERAAGSAPRWRSRASTSSPVTVLRVRIGVPIAPQATGAVLAIRQSKAAWNGSEPQPDQERRRDRHRRPEPGRPLDERPERERHQDRLEPPVAREPGDRRLHHVELAGRHRDVVEEDRRHDQPDDPEQREDDPHRRAGQHQVGRHPEGPDRHHAGRHQAGQGRLPGIRPAPRPGAPGAPAPAGPPRRVETGQYPERVVLLRPYGTVDRSPAIDGRSPARRRDPGTALGRPRRPQTIRHPPGRG